MKEDFAPMAPLNGTVFSKYKDKIVDRIKINDGYCPCVKERNMATMCPCEDYINTKKCHCTLYVLKEEENNV